MKPRVEFRLYSANSSGFVPGDLRPNEIYLQGMTVARSNVTVRLPANERRVLIILIAHQHERLTRAQIVEMLYGDDIEGGPDRADKMVDIAISGLRDAGAALGFRIESTHYLGYILRPIAYPEMSDAA